MSQDTPKNLTHMRTRDIGVMFSEQEYGKPYDYVMPITETKAILDRVRMFLSRARGRRAKYNVPYRVFTTYAKVLPKEEWKTLLPEGMQYVQITIAQRNWDLVNELAQEISI